VTECHVSILLGAYVLLCHLYLIQTWLIGEAGTDTGGLHGSCGAY